MDDTTWKELMLQKLELSTRLVILHDCKGLTGNKLHQHVDSVKSLSFAPDLQHSFKHWVLFCLELHAASPP